jgi:hypothetical protein
VEVDRERRHRLEVERVAGVGGGFGAFGALPQVRSGPWSRRGDCDRGQPKDARAEEVPPQALRVAVPALRFEVAGPVALPHREDRAGARPTGTLPPSAKQRAEHLWHLQKDASARPAHVAELVKALLPFAASATQTSLDRTSRVLRRAGVNVEDPATPFPGAPPTSAPLASAQAISAPLAVAPVAAPSSIGPSSPSTSAAEGARSNTLWDASSNAGARPRSSRRTPLYAGLALGMLAVGGGIAFVATSHQEPAAVAVTPDPTAAPPPPPPQVTAAPTDPSTPQPVAQPAPTVSPDPGPGNVDAGRPVADTSRTGKAKHPTPGKPTAGPTKIAAPPKAGNAEDFGDRR